MATALVAALAMSQPAQAERIDGGKLLLGLAGVAVLAHIIDRHGKRKKAAPAPVVEPRQRHRTRIDYRQCLRQRWTPSGWEQYVSQRCVNRLQRRDDRPRGRGIGHGVRY